MYKRFYEIDNAEQFADGCREIWDLPCNAGIGPVNTNFPADRGKDIKLVVVCESPSCNEVALGRPAVASTGKSIYYRYCEANELNYNKFYSFSECYGFFAENGIYITNLIRCQVNFGIPSPRVKNKRVKMAWGYNRDFLKNELKKIACVSPDTCVIFAGGGAYNRQIKEAVNWVEELNMNWLVSFQPTRLKREYAWHFNTSLWGEQSRTWPKERGE